MFVKFLAAKNSLYCYMNKTELFFVFKGSSLMVGQAVKKRSNPKIRKLESGIWNPEFGIQNAESRIRNPESRIQNSETGNWNPESSGIQK